MSVTRVLLADDNLPVRVGLKHLITQQPDMDVVADASDGQEALQLAQTLSPDPPWPTSPCRGGMASAWRKR